MKKILILLLISLSACLEDPIQTSIPENFLSSSVNINDTLLITSSSGEIFQYNGAEFTSLPVNNSTLLLDIDSKNDFTAASGESGRLLYELGDGLWRISPTGVSGYLRSITILDDSTAIASGQSGNIIVTNDTASSWQQINSPSTRDVYSLLAVSRDTMVVGVRGDNTGGTFLFYTYDGGNIWSTVELPDNNVVSSLALFNNSLVIGTDDKLFVSDLSFQTIDEVFTHDEEGIFVIEDLLIDNGIYLLGYTGYNIGSIYYSQDLTTFTEQTLDGDIYITSGNMLNGTPVAFGGYGKKIATKSGNNWLVTEQ